VGTRATGAGDRPDARAAREARASGLYRAASPILPFL